MTRHLQVCPQRQAAIQEASQRPGQEQLLLHLQVQDAWAAPYWMHLEMNGSAPLSALDDYLRAIWLECCGHLSQFSIGGWGGPEIPMRRRADTVFKPGITLTHIYDFGTSSETLIKAIGARRGRPLTANPIYLMARNDLPELPCAECDRPATWLCQVCMEQTDELLALCDEHATAHEHYNEMTPIVNSPRVGMCGYNGPAEPPY